MDASSSPTIALMIPTYNRKKFLCMLLDSVPRDVPCYVSYNDGCLKGSSLFGYAPALSSIEGVVREAAVLLGR